jgi:GntR family transcriptional regulator / MocR family aminotransferase
MLPFVTIDHRPPSPGPTVCHMHRLRWTLVLDLDRSSRQPMYIQISRAIADDIRRGRLRPGDVLPGTRALAATLGINRVTVLTAYDELAAEGWISTHPARGCVVAHSVPELTPGRTRLSHRGLSEQPTYALPPTTVVPRSPEHLRGLLVLGASSPDARLLDVEPLARAYRRALRKAGGRLLGYADPQGYPRLRSSIARMLNSTRGISIDTSQIFVTRGSQMAISLTARALLRPGDVVGVEALGYRQIWQTLTSTGATVLPIPVDACGMNTEELAGVADEQPLKAVYVTPHHQFPTTARMAPQRRRHLLDLAQQHRFAVIEDDYDHEFHYDGPAQKPLASLDSGSAVIYIGSFSKLLAPGVRLGFIAGPTMLMQHLAVHREYIDMQGDAITEAAVAEMLEDGEVQRHVRRVRCVYRDRRDLFVDLLRKTFGSQLEFDLPDGGVALWVRAADVDVSAWATAALGHKVAFQSGEQFNFHSRPLPAARLGFACLDNTELREAVRRLRTALDDLQARRYSA